MTPMIPQRVHTIRGPNDGTRTSSGQGSAVSRLFMVDARPDPAVKKHNDQDPRCYDHRNGEEL
jgi:hypothetical protein